jgi:hypothetical protein
MEEGKEDAMMMCENGKDLFQEILSVGNPRIA